MHRTWPVLAACLTLLAAGCGGASANRPGAPEPVAAGPLPPLVARGGVVHLGRDGRAFVRPEAADPTCVGRALMWQKAAIGVENRVKFAVLRDGSLARFSFERPVGPEIAAAVERAFRSCTWSPGKDPEGNPIAVWVIQPIKVHPPSGS